VCEAKTQKRPRSTNRCAKPTLPCQSKVSTLTTKNRAILKNFIPKRLRSVLAAAALAVAFTSFVPMTAEAHGQDSYGHESNGCTGVPDGIFHGACDQHDWCYDSPSTPNSEAGRLDCDNRFLYDMLDACAVTYPVSYRQPQSYIARRLCNATAQTYFRGVRSWGGDYFQNTNKN
jgi:Prokaryotic phospholipase A2